MNRYQIWHDEEMRIVSSRVDSQPDASVTDNGVWLLYVFKVIRSIKCPCNGIFLYFFYIFCITSSHCILCFYLNNKIKPKVECARTLNINLENTVFSWYTGHWWYVCIYFTSLLYCICIFVRNKRNNNNNVRAVSPLLGLLFLGLGRFIFIIIHWLVKVSQQTTNDEFSLIKSKRCLM